MKSFDPKAELQKQALDLLASKRAVFVQAAARVVRCRCLAEDVVQDAVLKICENGIDSGVRRLPSYLFRMVHNLSIDCARRLGREQRILGPEDSAEHVRAPCACPEATLEHCEALNAIMRALAELPERTRHAFEAHRIDGVPQREIAAALSVSPTLVNFMIRDAHHHCRQHFALYEAGGEAAPKNAIKKPARRRARQADAIGGAAVRRPAEIAERRTSSR